MSSIPKLRAMVLVTLLCLMIFGPDPGASGKTGTHKQGHWRIYHGAWFAVMYPSGFTVRPVQRSVTYPDGGYDSAFFIAPDKSVQFYVYSPQWNGTPEGIRFDPKTENILSSSHSTVKKTNRTITVTRRTIQAKNHHYVRSVEDMETDQNTRAVFAIQYRDQQAYQKYRARYLRFKQSLEQYAD